MGNKLKNRRLKYMQLSCFSGLLLFRGRVHLRWQSFAGEKRGLLRCGERGVTECARQPARPELPWHKSWLLEDPSQDKTGVCLRTFLSFPPPEMHFVFSCHCCHSVAGSPEQPVLAMCWAAGMPICGTSTVSSTVWQRTQVCEVWALLSSCISLWHISELEFSGFLHIWLYLLHLARFSRVLLQHDGTQKFHILFKNKLLLMQSYDSGIWSDRHVKPVV